MGAEMKTCIHCHTEKPLGCFNLYKRSKDGRTATCKQCRNEKETAKRDIAKERERYHANKEKHKTKRIEYAQKNAEAIRERVKKWRHENPERFCKLKKNHVKKRVSDTRDGYVRGLLTRGASLSTQDIPELLVECKKLELKIKREIKEMK